LNALNQVDRLKTAGWRETVASCANASRWRKSGSRTI